MRNLLNEADRRRLGDRLRALRPDAMGRWGRMSAHQMVCHLGDALRVPLGDKTTRPVPPLMPVTVIKFVALRVPFPWPRDFPAPPELRQGVGGTRPSDFQHDVDAVFGLFDRFAAAGDLLALSSHPIFGPLSVQEWGRWAYRHTHHHLRQFGC
jgi:hypothetical protein